MRVRSFDIDFIRGREPIGGGHLLRHDHCLLRAWVSFRRAYLQAMLHHSYVTFEKEKFAVTPKGQQLVDEVKGRGGPAAV